MAYKTAEERLKYAKKQRARARGTGDDRQDFLGYRTNPKGKPKMAAKRRKYGSGK